MTPRLFDQHGTPLMSGSPATRGMLGYRYHMPKRSRARLGQRIAQVLGLLALGVFLAAALLILNWAGV